jgi:hypothetical protein
LEEAYFGFRSDNPDGVSVDVSAGARELKLGTGMLFANGGSSGFERGALKFGPRKAWELAGIAKFMKNGFSLTGFYLDPNEVPSNDAFTELAGGDFRFDGADGGFAGVTYANVLKSNSAYPQADPGNPPIITPGAREGLNVINVYGRTGKLSGALTNWYFSADLAYHYGWRQTAPLSAQESDPKVMGWMQGFPPPPDKLITQPDSATTSAFPSCAGRSATCASSCPPRRSAAVLARRCR